MTPTIEDFDFGTTDKLDLPELEPPPSEWLLFTAWHINRALEYIRRGQQNYTIPHIFATFKVLSPVPCRATQLTFIRSSRWSVRSNRSFGLGTGVLSPSRSGRQRKSENKPASSYTPSFRGKSERDAPVARHMAAAGRLQCVSQRGHDGRTARA